MQRTSTYNVGVHIADVSHFVRPGSQLDTEARQRGVTTYHFSKVLPMLPTILSSDICSLQPNLDRLAVSVFFTLNENGSLAATPAPRIVKSVIRSRQKLSYAQVTQYFDDAQSPHGIPKTLTSQLDTFLLLTRKRREQHETEKRLYLDMRPYFVFETTPSSVKGWPDRLYPAEDRREEDAHAIIEELMILTNRIVSTRLLEMWNINRVDSILRRHHANTNRMRNRLLNYVSTLPGVSLDLPENSTVSEILATVKRTCPTSALIAATQYLCTAFSRAVYVPTSEPQALDAPNSVPVTCVTNAVQSPSSDYDHSAKSSEPPATQALQQEDTLPYDGHLSVFPPREDIRHDALDIPIYTHFTSPIRRYPDLLIHQVLTEELRQPANPTFRAAATTPVSEIFTVCQECNEIVRRQKNVTFDLVKRVFNQYIRYQYPKGYELCEPVVISIRQDHYRTLQKTLVIASPTKSKNRKRHPNIHSAKTKLALPCTITLFIRELNCTASISSLTLGKVVERLYKPKSDILQQCRVVNDTGSALFTIGSVARLNATAGTDYVQFHLPNPEK